MFQIGIGTGMALQEILKLKNKDVKGKSSISVSIGAREIVTTYEFSEEDQKIIDELVKDKDPDGYLILGHTNSTAPLSREQAYRVFKAVGQSVGISAIGAQTMRKTYAWRYYKSTGDITYLQHMFNHASPAITYIYIGEKPNIQVVLRKNTAEENERSRYLLYLNDTGRKRLTAAIDELAAIRNKFDDPTNNDSFYGCVDCFLEELDGLIENYKQSLPDNE